MEQHTEKRKNNYNIQVPEKPRFFTKFNMQMCGTGILMLVIAKGLHLLATARRETDIILFLLFLIVGAIGVFLVGIMPVAYCIDMRNYLQASKDYDGYVKRRTEEIERNIEKSAENHRRTIERQKAQAKNEAERLEKLPMCPICGKKDRVKRISTLNRSASVAAFGLASSKIGKQYQCERCKHLF